MAKYKTSRDVDLAYELHQEINCFGVTENAILGSHSDKGNYKPRTLTDDTLEFIDPTPNIHTLFVQFNERFFWNMLLPVELKWSPRMTSCAGVCTFHPRNRQCVISLSAPLLKLRPRKDLVETLLHEMIHGYLFLTNNNRDRDGHGPEFCKHMNRINNAAGTRITIYHSFHDEVRLYQQHWWRCNGPCQKRAPYFGTVRRSINRAPGPSDFWWKQHQQTCGGQFIKIKEPEKTKTKNAKNKEVVKSISKTSSGTNLSNWITTSITSPKSTSTPKQTKPVKNGQITPNNFKKLGNSTNNINGWGTKGPSGSSHSKLPTSKSISKPGKSKTNTFNRFATNSTSVTTIKSVPTSNHSESTQNSPSTMNGFKKLGNVTNNVHGWGTGGPNGSNNSKVPANSASTIPKFSSSGTLGGSSLGRSNLLDKFNTGNHNHKSSTNIKSPNNKTDAWTNNKKTTSIQNDGSFSETSEKLIECPICNDFVPDSAINEHLDICLTKPNLESKRSEEVFTQKRKINTPTFPSKHPKLDNSENSERASCPICNKYFPLAVINEHLDECLAGVSEEGNNSTVELDDSHSSTSKNYSVISISSSNTSDSSIDETPSSSYSSTNLRKHETVKNTAHKCLVCDMLITPEMSLNDHLEDCIGSVFNDDLTLQSDCDTKEKLETSLETSLEKSDTQDNEYPCPVCMELILEPLMNYHLDTCLNR